MGLRIQTNVSALSALNALSRNRGSLQKAFERLSSGKRINSAADDAAGLAISSRFTAQIRGLGQAIRNTSDAVSYTQTADGALAGSSDILQRMRELAVQAGNGTLTDQDRQAIQAEVSQLSGELERIGGTTRFNGRPLLDGSGGNQTFQVGANANETVGVPAFDARASALGQAAVAQGGAIAANGLQAGELSINGVGIRATTAADDPASTANAAGSARSVARAINDSSAATGVRAEVDDARVTGGPVGGGTLDSANQLVINGRAISSVDVQAGDAGDRLVRAINAESERTGVLAERDASGGLRLSARDGRNIEVQTTGTAAATTGLTSGVTSGSVRLVSEQPFTIAGAAPGDAGLAAGAVGLDPTSAVAGADVTTVDAANRTLATVDRALGQVSATRARFGALQNRFESTLSNLSNVGESLSAANSRIADADFGVEVANLARAQLLERAGISVLAQANVSGRAALRLLG